MRNISTDLITKNIKEMCIEANYLLSPDVKKAVLDAASSETSANGKNILEQLEKIWTLQKLKAYRYARTQEWL